MIVLLHVHHVVEHIAAAIEGVVGVEHHEAEAPAVAVAEGLHVVAQPVVAAEVEFGGHVVDILIDVEHLADILIDLVVAGIGRHRHELLINLVVAALLHIERVGRDLEQVYFIVVPAVVGIDIVLVVRFAHVKHTDVLAVDEFVDGLVGLPVEVDARTLNDGLDGSILDAAAVIIAAIADLQRAVVDIGLGSKEGIVQPLRAAIFFLSLQLERVRCPRTAPTSAHLDINVLVEDHFTISVEVGEVDGSCPVHVPVALRRLSVAGTSVLAAHVDAQRVVVEESRVADDTHYGQTVVVAVIIDEGAGSGGRRQVAVGKQAETILRCLTDIELSAAAGCTVRQGGQRAVSGVAQGTASRNVDAQGDGASEELRRLVDNRWCQLLGGIGGFVVRGSRRRCCCGAPFFAAVGSAGIADALHRCRIVLLAD